jgi:hypothetical protein
MDTDCVGESADWAILVSMWSDRRKTSAENFFDEANRLARNAGLLGTSGESFLYGRRRRPA